ncbi:MAG: metallophosphoesterase family protein, partial [Acidimicrobiia bacterium]|nr:metallophosphoesterase family protein [Acidimicrobiia bacterium]
QLALNRDPALARQAYLQSGSATGVTVRWRTDIATDSEVRYGTQLGMLNSNVQLAALTTEHVVELTGLSADTPYYYSFGGIANPMAGDDPDHFFVTAPTTGTAKPTRVWIIGDPGKGSTGQLDVRDAYETFTGATLTDLWLMLGDNAYESGTDAEYQTKLFDVYTALLRKSVLWPTLGNHDALTSDSPTQTGPYYANFTLPTAAEAGGVASGTEAYYSFDYGNIHFVVLNSSDSPRTAGSAMLTWLAADLAATTQDWIIAVWHHPAYSKGSHDSDAEVELIEMRENVIPILDSHGVDLTFTGHSHSYERSFLIDGVYATPTPDFATLLAAGKILDAGNGQIGGDGAYAKTMTGQDPNSGIVHTVAGTAGQVTGAPLNHPVMFTGVVALGSVVLDINGNQADVQFLDSTGVVLDNFTMTKGP